MAKKGRIKVELRSTETSHSYTTTKNPQKAEKMELRKFDPKARKHVVYKEGKIKK